MAEEPKLEPALVVRAIHPERQAAAVIGLFAGSKAASPAAAMAAWRRATGNHEGIGKTLQAIVALFNPEMVPEWRAIDDARFNLAVEGARPGPLWGLVAPRDDGSIAAVITSLRLSGGADEPPILKNPPIAVERLGGPGAALAARLPDATVFANHRDMLATEIQRLRAGKVDSAAPALFGPDDSGFAIALRFDRLAVDAQTVPGLARVATTAKAVGLTTTDGKLGLRGDRLELEFVSRVQQDGTSNIDAASPSLALDPSWLAWYPERGTAAAAAIVLGPGAEFWNGLFQIADAVDRATPARANLAPLRTRLNFLGLARGVRFEADLWPHLRGASFGLLIDEGAPAKLGGAVLALHADDAQGARRIFDKVVRPLAGSTGDDIPPPGEGGGDPPHRFGEVSGRQLEAVVSGSTVLIGWGSGTLDRASQSNKKPDESLAALLKKQRKEGDSDGRSINRFGAVWPGRAASALGVWEPRSPLAAAMAEASPVVWRGGWDGALAWDAADWPELRGVVARFLEQIPQAPFETP